MTNYAHTVDTLDASHVADLRSVDANPRHVLQPQRRKMLVRLGVLAPCEPPREPGDGPRNPPARAHVVTAKGREAMAREHNDP